MELWPFCTGQRIYVRRRDILQVCRQWGRKLTNRFKPHRDHRDISLYIKLVHANKMHATPYCKINYFFLASLIVPLISCYYFVKCVIITQARKYNVFNSCVILTENKFWLEVLLKISTWIFIETPSMEAESSMWQKDRQEGRHTDRLTWRCKWSLSHGFAKSPVCASAMSFLLGCEIPV